MRAAALAECTVRHISLDDPSALRDTVTVSADATLSVSAMNLPFQLELRPRRLCGWTGSIGDVSTV